MTTLVVRPADTISFCISLDNLGFESDEITVPVFDLNIISVVNTDIRVETVDQSRELKQMVRLLIKAISDEDKAIEFRYDLRSGGIKFAIDRMMGLDK